jgi:hypothetical protein
MSLQPFTQVHLMRKRLTQLAEQSLSGFQEDWLDLERLAMVEVTSEEAAYPIESALLADDGSGWLAGESGPQRIRILFDEPQHLRRIWLHFIEPAAQRTHEFVVRWSANKSQPLQEIARQQWNFSPAGATTETEDYRVDLANVTVLELAITPNISGGGARASLKGLRLA